MKALFIQYPKCSTCKKAAKWLAEHKIDVRSRHIVEDNPNAEELEEWIKMSNLPIQRFFNTSGQLYRTLKLKDIVKTGTEKELLNILASDGMLVKRPIVVFNNKVLIGFKEAEWAEFFK